MAWMEHGLQISLRRYAFSRKIKWRLELLGVLRIMGDTARIKSCLVTFHFCSQIEHPRPFYERNVMIEQCISEDNVTSLAILLLPKMLLVLIGAVAGWTTRMVFIPLCNNTRSCSLCLGIVLVTCVIEVPVALRLREYPNAFFGITGVVVIILVLVLLAVGVLPQVREMYLQNMKG